MLKMTMKYKTSLFLMFTLNGVWSSNCGTEELKKLFDGGVIQCPTEETWSYSESDENFDVPDFLTPGLGVSCIGSHMLPMKSGDYIEVNVFTDSIAKEDYVTVIVYDAVENKVVGKATLSSEDGAENGWNVVKILLDGPASFNGYITLTGEASLNSVLLVGSVCYSAKDQSELKEDTTNVTSSYVSNLNKLKLQTGLNTNLESDVIEKVDLNDPANRAGRFIEDLSWTPLTISLAVVIPVVILSLLAWSCYALGKCRGAKREPEIIYEDVNNIPKPYLVPRVKNVYAESVNGSTYGARHNNIYSV